MADREQQRGEISPFAIALRGLTGGIISERAKEVAGLIIFQRGGEGVGFRVGQAEISQINNAGIVEPPLDDVAGLDDGGLEGSLAGAGLAFLARRKQDAVEIVGYADFAIEDEVVRSAVRIHVNGKFGAARGGEGIGGLNLEFAGLVAGEKVDGTRFQIDGGFARRVPWRQDFQGGEFVDAQPAKFGKLEQGAALSEGPHPVPDEQRLPDDGRRPVGFTAGKIH